MSIEVNLHSIKSAIYLYIALPICIFCVGWLRWYISIPMVLLLGYSVFCMISKSSNKNDKISLRVNHIVIITIVAFLWCFLAGQGGFFYQSQDHNARNAIFRDLIMKEWPVTYEGGNAGLVYYIGHWMIPAVIGKLSLVLFTADTAWKIANIMLFLWSGIGILFIELLLIKVTKAFSLKKMVIALTMLIFFSGMDIIGIILQCFTNNRLILIEHIECWATVAQYSSLTTCLFWVFNQAIVPWIIVLLYLDDESYSNYAFLGISCIAYGPLPALGLVPFFVCNAIHLLIIRKQRIVDVLKNIFSFQNIYATVFILPVYFLFYKTNYAYVGTGVSTVLETPWSIQKTAMVLIAFFLFEFAIYAFIISDYYKKNINFYITVVVLSLIVLFKVGTSIDFTMRVSIPAIFVLMVLILKYIFACQEKIQNFKVKRWRYLLLSLTLAIGMMTPLVEYLRAGYYVAKNGKLAVVADNIITLEGKELDVTQNFIATDIEDKFFFKYLIREDYK